MGEGLCVCRVGRLAVWEGGGAGRSAAWALPLTGTWSTHPSQPVPHCAIPLHCAHAQSCQNATDCTYLPELCSAAHSLAHWSSCPTPNPTYPSSLTPQARQLHSRQQNVSDAACSRYTPHLHSLPSTQPPCPSSPPHRRASYTPRYIRPPPKARAGKESYWDRVSLDAPNPLALLPDKWYVRVAFLVVVVGVTVYLNMVAAGAK